MPAVPGEQEQEPDGSELERLRLQGARLEGQVEALRVQVEVRMSIESDQREVIVDLERQLAERDEALEGEHDERRRMEESFRATDRWRAENERALMRDNEALKAELDEMKGTRLWRLGERYWSLKNRRRRGS